MHKLFFIFPIQLIFIDRIRVLKINGFKIEATIGGSSIYQFMGRTSHGEESTYFHWYFFLKTA